MLWDNIMKKPLVGAMLLLSSICQAGNVEVWVFDNNNKPVVNVAVHLNNQNIVSLPVVQDMPIMDQIKKQFSPHILVVQKNTQIRFPNSDLIKHHVYSFSPAKVFQLKLYKGLNADPLLFSKTGVVELGCNVHDSMLGYIYVVDTPYFGKTDANGRFSIEVPDADYQVRLWHPQIQDGMDSLLKTLAVNGRSNISFTLQQTLLPSSVLYEQDTEEFGDYE
jgi:plastocyanin